MHQQSHNLMKGFVDKYLKGGETVIDIGSLDVNGNYADLFTNQDYKGLDICEGANVDIVSKDLYSFPVEDESYDVVISGNCIEHVEYTWEWIREVGRILKKGGKACIITPYKIHVHRYPIDCYRILSDGFTALIKWLSQNDPDSTYQILENRFDEIDTYLVFTKE